MTNKQSMPRTVVEKKPNKLNWGAMLFLVTLFVVFRAITVNQGKHYEFAPQ